MLTLFDAEAGASGLASECTARKGAGSAEERRYIGNGEGFLFVLNPFQRKYPWRNPEVKHFTNTD